MSSGTVSSSSSAQASALVAGVVVWLREEIMSQVTHFWEARQRRLRVVHGTTGRGAFQKEQSSDHKNSPPHGFSYKLLACMPTPPRILLPLLALLCTSAAWGATGRLVVQPESLALTGLDREHGLLVTLVEPEGRQRDVTAASRFTSSAPATVAVDAKGHAKAITDGVTRIAVEYEGLIAACEVSVSNTATPAVPSFNQD